MANTTGKKFGGRVKGTPNKSTDRARQAIAQFCESNSERMQGWLDDVATDDPYKALMIVKDLLEYHVPKLSRSDNTVDVSGSLSLTKQLDALDGTSTGLPKEDR
jgi:hypothetical protein